MLADSGTGTPLAAADRFLNNGGHIYSNVEDGLLVSCTYFPGDVFLAIVCRVFFGYYAETAMILIGGSLFLIAAIIFVNMVGTTQLSRTSLGICMTVLTILSFPSLKKYLLEVHPDVPAINFL